jgi:DNA repair exonuclease SbcCD ATPase subunit
VRRSLERLERLRQTLLEQLETALTRVEARWGQQQLEAVRLAAQKLADQLSEVEELEARLEHLLNPGSGP